MVLNQKKAMKEKHKNNKHVTNENKEKVYHQYPPENGTFNVNVDVSVHKGSYFFTIGMTPRDHTEMFMKGKIL